MHDIVLFGPPGCGKGTQAARLTRYRHVSTGALFREAVAAQTDLGREIEATLGTGKLISDDITCRVAESVCGTSEPIVWDGFPRTVNQAVLFDEMLTRHGRTIKSIINLVVPSDVLLKRVLARNQGRPEDNAETFALRLKVYEEQTAPILSHYDGRVTYLFGIHSEDEVAEMIEAMVA